MSYYSHFSTVLAIQESGGASYTTIGQIRGIGNAFSFERTSIETTDFTASNRYKTFIPGERDPGTAEFEVYLDPSLATHAPTSAGLIALFNTDNADDSIRITYPDGSTLTGDGFVKAITNVVPRDDALTATITIQRTGAPTWE